MNDKIRLNKYLSLCGIASRRKCDEIIEKGLVLINGKIATEMGIQVTAQDTIVYNGKIVKPEETLYIALNKPVGVVTTLSDPEDRPTVARYFKDLPLIKPVGRLDINTSGLLIFTNDGDLHYKLTHPKFQIPKLYKVIVRGRVSDTISAQIQRGIRLEDGKVARGIIKSTQTVDHSTEILLELREGINREIRRIFEKLEYKVQSLDRIEFAGIKKEGLKPGEWRYLTGTEIEKLRKY